MEPANPRKCERRAGAQHLDPRVRRRRVDEYGDKLVEPSLHPADDVELAPVDDEDIVLPERCAELERLVRSSLCGLEVAGEDVRGRSMQQVLPQQQRAADAARVCWWRPCCGPASTSRSPAASAASPGYVRVQNRRAGSLKESAT